jgi:hypothetical protein
VCCRKKEIKKMQETSHGIHKYTKCDKDGVPLLVQEIDFGDTPGFDNVVVTYFDRDYQPILGYGYIIACTPIGLPTELYIAAFKDAAFKFAEEIWKPVTGHM